MELSSTSPMMDYEEKELWTAWKLSRDVDAYHKLIDRYKPLAKKLAYQQYLQHGHNEIELDDFYQYAVLGLMESIDRFDINLGTKFSTFASFRIKGSVYNEISRFTERRSAYSGSREKERFDSIVEQAQADNFNEFEEFVDISLGVAVDKLLSDISEDIDQDEQCKDPYHGEFFGQIRKILRDIVDALQSPDDLVVRYHYFYHMAFHEIGKIFGYSASTVYRIHGRAIRMIRRIYERKFEFEEYY